MRRILDIDEAKAWRKWALILYGVFALAWGTRLLGHVMGDGLLLQTLILVVHVTVGAAIGMIAAALLPLVPITIAVVTGSDLVEGFLVFIFVGTAFLILVGVVIRKLGEALARRARGRAEPSPLT